MRPYILLYIAYAFVTKAGDALYPDGIKDYLKDENMRKPNPGMILRAMKFKGIRNSVDVLMIGDRPEDEQAAQAAGVKFVHADEFFGRTK